MISPNWESILRTVLYWKKETKHHEVNTLWNVMLLSLLFFSKMLGNTLSLGANVEISNLYRSLSNRKYTLD